MSNNLSMGLQSSDWRRLVQSILDGNCILVLGPSIVKDRGDPDNPSISELLVEELRKELGENVIPSDFQGSLPLVAQMWLDERENYQLDLQIVAAKKFKTCTDSCSSKIHEELAELPFRLCITTTPDQFMVQAFSSSSQQKAPRWGYFRVGENADSLPKGSAKSPTVFSLVGDMKHNRSLLVTESDLLGSFTELVRGSGPLPATVSSELVSADNLFLFIGFDFSRCHSRLLAQVLQKNRQHGDHSLPSLGVAAPHNHTPETATLNQDKRDFVVEEDIGSSELYYKIVHSISIRHTDWYAFAKELRQRYEDEDEDTTSKPRQVPQESTNAPKVFLCHASEDREAVERLEAQLKDHEIGIWRDVSNLPPGAHWEQYIKRALKKEVDYVLVCETENMVGFQRGNQEKHFWQEIRIALDRMNRMPPGLMFVIPATLIQTPDCDRCGLEILNDLHRVDAYTPEAVSDLAERIKKDWSSRQVSAVEG